VKQGFIFLFTGVLALMGCETVIDLPLTSNPHKVVVDGLITTEPGPYYVNLWYTTNYSFGDSTDLTEFISGARVVIKDDLGHSEPLREVIPGRYRTDSLSAFRGEVGRSYAIDIITEAGKHYVSIPEKMPARVLIDSVYYFLSHPMEGGEYFELYIDYTDPVGKGNNYRWHSSVNGFYLIDIDIDNDQFTDGQTINGRRLFGFRFFSNIDSVSTTDSMVVEVNQASLTKEAFDFWTVAQQHYNPQDNAPYDIPPSPLIGNIHNADDPDDFALGYFGASGFSTVRVVVRK
jgi:hypothetical protein